MIPTTGSPFAILITVIIILVVHDSIEIASSSSFVEYHDTTRTTSTSFEDSTTCGIYMAESILPDDIISSMVVGRYVLYAGTDYTTPYQSISHHDLIIPIINANKNEYSPWHDYIWGESFLPSHLTELNHYSRSSSSSSFTGSNMQHQQQPEILNREFFIAGIAAMSPCSSISNVQPNYNETYQLQESTRPSALEYEYFYPYYNYTMTTIQTIRPGQMIINQCNNDDNYPVLQQSMDILQKQGVCVDTIQVQSSTIPNSGLGAFAKQYHTIGDILTVSPVIHLDRSQMNIVQQTMDQSQHRIPIMRHHGIQYNATNIYDQQLLLNYCYGHPNSNVLFLPYGPGVNYINHHSTQANVYIRWSQNPFHNINNQTQQYMYDTPLMELYEISAMTTSFVIEYVVMNHIQPGDEIFLDYGRNFEVALQQYYDTSYDDVDTETTKIQTKPFRHEIGVPDGMYMDHWMRTDTKPYGDFIANPLSPGHMAPIRWLETAEIVTPWAFRIGLRHRVRNVLLHYCHKMGITDILRSVTIEGNGLEPGNEIDLQLDGNDWYLQRPESFWRSNLHWISPGSGPAHEHYLQALSVAGFDEILNGIGEYLGMDGLVAFHVTFIGVSFSNRGFPHFDVQHTGAKVYNIIIPLLLANETGPELDLQSWKPDLPSTQEIRTGRYRYEYNIASMMGDNAVHATSACDYRNTNEMRMAATVYVADVNDINAEQILNFYTQKYPPRDLDLIQSWQGRHWKKDDRKRRLPKPPSNHILIRDGWNKVHRVRGPVPSTLFSDIPSEEL